MQKVLLLNYTYEIISFITGKRALRLLFKGKADVISEWNNLIVWASGKINLPAILRMKYYIHKTFSQLPFTRRAVFKRDKYTCRYCNKKLKSGCATIDHILPKCLGGTSSFTNCVASCFECNSKKGNKILNATNMKLISNPIVPSKHLHFLTDDDAWHDDWNKFFKEYGI